MSSIIIGLDPGISSLGYGIIKNEKNKNIYLAHGVISTNIQKAFSKRLLELAEKLSRVIEDYRPDEAAVEDLFFAKNSKTYATVAQAKGVVLFTLARHEVAVSEYSPLFIKKALVGSGRALKTQIKELVRFCLGLKEGPTPEHAADALAVAICHANQLNFAKVLRKAVKYHV